MFSQASEAVPYKAVGPFNSSLAVCRVWLLSPSFYSIFFLSLSSRSDLGGTTAMSCDLKARELAQYDDIASSLCVDPIVGFTTHKMNPRFRHVKGR